MAFATGHTPPTGFVAGQLMDGAVFGSFNVGSFGSPPQANVSIKVILRYYKGMLIVMTQSGNNPTMDNVETQHVKGQEYMKNLVNYPGITGIPAFSSLIPLVATNAQVASVGIADNALTLNQSTGAPIPYQQDANGIVTAYVDPVKTQNDVNQALIGIANKQNVLPTDPNAPANTPGTASTTNWKRIILYCIIGAIVIIGGIVLFKSMNKGGKSHSSGGMSGGKHRRNDKGEYVN